MPLQNQVQIYSTDTAAFYSNNESYLHKLNHKVRSERRKLVEERKKIESKFEEYGISPKEIDGFDHSMVDDDKLDEMVELSEKHKKINKHVLIKNKKAKETKERLLSLLSNKVETNISQDGKHHIRKLDEKNLSDKNVISVFESYFTRTIGAEIDELCEDFMVIQVFYFDVIKDLIYHGFTFKGEKYIYFTSSAGQIRTKKCVFVKESVWKKYEKTIMCGLTIDDINAKGGNNPNKHLAYLALANSATDVWEDFDIDKTIVINDFETEVDGEYDFIDDIDYSVTRTSGHAAIEHTDGAGMMLPCMGKNRMVRLPWVKGLLGVFDFKKFVEVHGCSPVIKDIYGKEHDIIAEDIQIIFTKSQFKMYKYYDSWDDYKEKYKKYGCTAGITNVEEDRIKDATINYQMLQSLTDIEDEEIEEIAKQSIDKLNNICSSIDNVKNAFGITPYNQNMSAFQKAVKIYPNLLSDKYTKEHLKNIKDSMVKRYRAGKLQVHGKYTFVLPDFYAACQHWFLGEENPDGLLNDGEVFCWLFRKSDELDCLRSPHLYREHPVRKNIASYSYKERQSALRIWFETDAIYTSCKDLISRILQFDVDGDKLLVVSDEKLIEVAKRNMEGIVPLYYNMRKAESAPINNAAIYNGLNAAFAGGNIGIYSNNISKIWNGDVFVSGSDEEKENAIDTIRLLCMENNYVIDYAKTLYKPERPEHINEQITSFTNEKLPHFFKYAKDKGANQVLEANKSFVNKLNKIIPNPKITLAKLGIGKIDYKKMMKNPDIEFDESDDVITKYCEFDREYYFSIDAALSNDELQSSDKFARKALKYKKMTDKIKSELSKTGKTDEEIVDTLVKYLYHTKKTKNKTALWMCYGDYIVNNLESNIDKADKFNTKTIKCVDCGEWIEIPRDKKHLKTCRCNECDDIYKRELRRLKKQRYRENKQCLPD